MLKWMSTGMALTTILMNEPSIPKKHFNIIKRYAELMAELLRAHTLFLGVIQKGRPSLWPEWIGISPGYAFLAFALFTDRSVLCHITMTSLSTEFPKEKQWMFYTTPATLFPWFF